MDLIKYDDAVLLFAVNIYFRNIDGWRKKYYIELDKYLEENRKQFLHGIGEEPQKEDMITWEVEFNKESTPWKYNEVIGIIEIKYFNDSILGYLYLSDARRYQPVMRYKRFLLKDELEIISGDISNKSNEEISQNILDFINGIEKYFSSLKRYYIDKENIANLLKLVDFSKLSVSF
ncbi:MAG: hypothetical protein JXI43_11410 [Tissierellales bacterium]|nr:hypothetical protein [Tissierellales bacterium]